MSSPLFYSRRAKRFYRKIRPTEQSAYEKSKLLIHSRNTNQAENEKCTRFNTYLLFRSYSKWILFSERAFLFVFFNNFVAVVVLSSILLSVSCVLEIAGCIGMRRVGRVGATQSKIDRINAFYPYANEKHTHRQRKLEKIDFVLGKASQILRQFFFLFDLISMSRDFTIPNNLLPSAYSLNENHMI